MYEEGMQQPPPMKRIHYPWLAEQRDSDAEQEDREFVEQYIRRSPAYRHELRTRLEEGTPW
jgi:hypothetical protein